MFFSNWNRHGHERRDRPQEVFKKLSPDVSDWIGPRSLVSKSLLETESPEKS